MKAIKITVASLAATLTILALAGTAQPAANYKIEVPLKNHLQLGMNEQDVFVERPAGSGMVYRITANDKDASAKIYTSSKPAAHNPVDPKDVGPFGKGPMLGMTQGEWLKASGSATLSCENGQGSLSARFKDLVPGGVYTFWYFFMPTPFAEPFTTYDLPLGARNGSENTFVAGKDGSINFSAKFKPCLQLSGEQLTAGLAIAYHSDGKTYGSNPGNFGTVSHVHLFNFLPKAAEATAAK